MSPRADYGGRHPVSGGGIVARVEPGTPAAAAEIRPGDRVLTVDGHALADILDWQWFSEGDRIAVDLASGDAERSVVLDRELGRPWGLEFEAALFDGVRTCRNACAFCFMTQLPKGLRSSLYLRDDDFRLSFLQGNFVSLTNLTDADVHRIAEQALSPLYFSLHAVTPDVRQRLVCARDDRALERADELLERGIDLHVQIVLVPGVNDGDELDRSLTWLAEREGILSVGVVPLGFTRYQRSFERSYSDPAEAGVIIDRVTPWHAGMRAEYGTGWVYLADEFYLAARRELPPAANYDDFPQYENGIGLARAFVDELAAQGPTIGTALEALARQGRHAVVVSGALFAPVLASALAAPLDSDAVARSDASATWRAPLRVLSVGNRFFGGNVSVTGLLTAEDIVAAIRADAGASGAADGTERVTYLVPDVILNADGLTLDDVRGVELGERSGCPVRLVSSDARGLVEGLVSLASPASF